VGGNKKAPTENSISAWYNWWARWDSNPWPSASEI